MAMLSVLGGASLPDGACQSRCFQRPRGKGAAQDRDPNPLLAPALSIEAGTRKIPHHPASNHGCRLFRGGSQQEKGLAARCHCPLARMATPRFHVPALREHGRWMWVIVRSFPWHALWRGYLWGQPFLAAA